MSDDSGIEPLSINSQLRNNPQLLAGLGLIVVTIAVINLLDISGIPVEPFIIYLTGIVISLLLILVAYFVKKRVNSNNIVITILLLSELSLFSTQVYYNFNVSSLFARVSLLIISIVIIAISTGSAHYTGRDTFQMIHLALAAYMAWIAIYLVAGSTFISKLLFTVVLMVVILILHYYAFMKFLPAITSVYFAYELFFLINANIINSSYPIFIVLTIALSVPGLIYHTRNMLVEQSKSMQNFVLLSSMIPFFVSLYIATNGALTSPYPHILIAMVSIIWILLIRQMEFNDNLKQRLAIIIPLLFMISVVIYSLNIRDITLLILYVAMITVSTVFQSLLSMKKRTIIQISNILILFIIVYLVYPSNFNFIMMLVVYLMAIPSIFGVEIFRAYRGLDANYDILQLFNAIFIAVLFILAPIQFNHIDYSNALYISAIIFSIVIYYLQKSFSHRYLFITISYAILSIAGFWYRNEYYVYILLILLGFFALFSISLIDKKLPSDQIYNAWLLLSIALIYSLLYAQGWIITLISSLPMLLGIIIFVIHRDIVYTAYFPVVFLSIGFISRIIVGQSDNIYLITSVFFAVIYTFFMLIMLFIIVKHPVKGMSKFTFIVYIFTWYVSMLLFRGVSVQIGNINIQKLNILIIQFGTLFLLLIGVYFRDIIWQLIAMILSYVNFYIDPVFVSINLKLVLLVISTASIAYSLNKINKSQSLAWFILTFINSLLVSIQGIIYLDLSIIIIFITSIISVSKFRDKSYMIFDYSLIYLVLSIYLRWYAYIDQEFYTHAYILWISAVILLNIILHLNNDTNRLQLLALVFIITTFAWLPLNTINYAIVIIFMVYSQLYLLWTMIGDKIPIDYLSFDMIMVHGSLALSLLNIVIELFNIYSIDLLIISDILFILSLVIFAGSIKIQLGKLSVVLTQFSFILLLFTTVTSFGSTAIANLIVTGLAVVMYATGRFRDIRFIQTVGKGVFILSWIIAVFDFIFLDTLNAWLSVIIAGLGLVIFSFISQIKNTKVTPQIKN